MRDLDWEGCCNVRDLGGLPTVGGQTIRWGAVVRSDNPARLTSAGWRSLEGHGVRTVVTLRTLGTTDPEPDPGLVPSGVRIERVELEDATDPEFRRRCVDTGSWATPLQWSEMLRWWPERCAEAVRAVARAGPGGILVSCGVGRDRTGLVTFLLLALAGVDVEDIAADWELSLGRLRADPLAGGLPVLEVLEREGTTVREAIERAVALDVEHRLVAGGLGADDVDMVRRRLLA
jgi:protein-tyrosine phosphatase